MNQRKTSSKAVESIHPAYIQNRCIYQLIYADRPGHLVEENKPKRRSLRNAKGSRRLRRAIEEIEEYDRQIAEHEEKILWESTPKFLDEMFDDDLAEIVKLSTAPWPPNCRNIAGAPRTYAKIRGGFLQMTRDESDISIAGIEGRTPVIRLIIRHLASYNK